MSSNWTKFMYRAKTLFFLTILSVLATSCASTGDPSSSTDTDDTSNTDNDTGFDTSWSNSDDGMLCAYGGEEPHVCECADGMDNDGDEEIDLVDLHCFGPFDDDESSFATGMPGDNNGSNAQTECPFDGNSGTGNDEEDCCDFDDPTEVVIPNGCDDHACCEVDINGNLSGEHVYIGGECDYAPECGEDGQLGCDCSNSDQCGADNFCVMDNDVGPGYCSTCEPCEPNMYCYNSCECAETCFGGFTQPDSECGDDIPGGDGCPDGAAECPNGDSDCDSSLNEVCVAGCCYPECPEDLIPCEDSSECPENFICLTGCCIDWTGPV